MSFKQGVIYERVWRGEKEEVYDVIIIKKHLKHAWRSYIWHKKWISDGVVTWHKYHLLFFGQ